MLIVAPVVLTVVIVARIAGQPDSYVAWGAFAALLVAESQPPSRPSVSVG